MELNLSGKKALVTGSSSGIGEGIAKTLAHEGAIVTVHGRNSERARRAADEINGAGGKAFVAVGDLTKDAEARHVAETAIEVMGGVDILVHNAGGADGEPVTWASGTIEDWREKFEQNLFGSAAACVPAAHANTGLGTHCAGGYRMGDATRRGRG
jgi:3-oxoacyl-[acyl-carrier protein] reductase